MEEIVGRKRRAVAVGALALVLGGGLGLGAVAWAGEGAAPEADVRLGETWLPSAGDRLVARAACCIRSHRAEVQRVLSAYQRSLEEEVSDVGAAEEPQGADDALGEETPRSSGEGLDVLSSGKSAVPSEESLRAGEPWHSQSAPHDAEGAEKKEENASATSLSNSGSSGGSRMEKDEEILEETRPEESAGAVGALAPGTLVVGGVAIPYCDVRGGTTPGSGGGLWLGSDAVDDGGWGYFVGHNPGSFAPVRSLSAGDSVVVCDWSGAQRAYSVRDVFRIEETATWKTIASRVTGYGESVVLQTCAGDGMNVIVVAA